MKKKKKKLDKSRWPPSAAKKGSMVFMDGLGGCSAQRIKKRFVPPTPGMGVASGAENAGLLIVVVI